MAGLMSYLVDLSMQTDGKPLGFLNPLLYQMYEEAPEAFSDITMGASAAPKQASWCFDAFEGALCSYPYWPPLTDSGLMREQCSWPCDGPSCLALLFPGMSLWTDCHTGPH